jgi:lysosomal acid lipase/cholesteryl ester hydrolase
MYDYGTEKENLEHYNQTTAPSYDLTKVSVPTALYSGGNDWLADPIDVDVLRKLLPNIVEDYAIETYNHMDLVWGINTKTMLYNRILDLIGKYE